jgi:hypothetical protein
MSLVATSHFLGVLGFVVSVWSELSPSATSLEGCDSSPFADGDSVPSDDGGDDGSGWTEGACGSPAATVERRAAAPLDAQPPNPPTTTTTDTKLGQSLVPRAKEKGRKEAILDFMASP